MKFFIIKTDRGNLWVIATSLLIVVSSRGSSSTYVLLILVIDPSLLELI